MVISADMEIKQVLATWIIWEGTKIRSATIADNVMSVQRGELWPIMLLFMLIINSNFNL